MSRALAGVLFSVFLLSAVAGCQTMEGLGEDVESAGENVQDQADDE